MWPMLIKAKRRGEFVPRGVVVVGGKITRASLQWGEDKYRELFL